LVICKNNNIKCKVRITSRKFAYDMEPHPSGSDIKCSKHLEFISLVDSMCSVLESIVWLFVLDLPLYICSILLRFTDSYYPFDIFVFIVFISLIKVCYVSSNICVLCTNEINSKCFEHLMSTLKHYTWSRLRCLSTPKLNLLNIFYISILC
jgi:hypothetical protein